MEKIVVSDTNILIDLCRMGLVSEFFTLPCEMHTVDMVISEIEDYSQKDMIMNVVKNGKLIIDQTSPEDIIKVLNLRSGNLSLTDSAVRFHAKRSSALLLTGDSRLRKLAEKDGIRIAGILFVLDKLVEYDKIKASYAAECLELFIEKNKRMPQEEAAVRLIRWTQIINNKEDKIM